MGRRRILITDHLLSSLSQAATRLRKLGRPAPAYYSSLQGGNAQKQMESFIERVLCATVDQAELVTPNREQRPKFTCRELSDGVGAWKRKLLLFERATAE